MIDQTIFVHIAAYRDPELIPTVVDCLSMASQPHRLRFGICWQYAKGDSLGDLIKLPNLQVISVPFEESKGACWARHMAQQLYAKETFYLQIDSHHRFEKGWDDQMIEMLTSLEADGVRKPILTAYPPGYDPSNDPAGRSKGAIQIDFNSFNDKTLFSLASSAIRDADKLTKPVRGRFMAGGFIFARGQYVTDVPYDPSLYFQGEEMSLSLRAFTHGYDLYHPHKVLLYHHYLRKELPKHWTDHKREVIPTLEPGQTWEDLNDASALRLKHLFSAGGHRYDAISWGPYGLGTERTIRQFEFFCGIDFGCRRITRRCLDKQPPELVQHIPDETWKASLMTYYEHTLEITGELFTCDDYDFIYLGFDRADGTNIHCTNIREDALKALLAKCQNKSAIVPIVSHFFSEQQPHRWAFWPHSKSKGWTQRLSGLMPRPVG